MRNQTQSSKNGGKEQMSNRNVFIFVAIIALLTCIVRYRIIEVPLERDEGGFAYMAQLILDGIPHFCY